MESVRIIEVAELPLEHSQNHFFKRVTAGLRLRKLLVVGGFFNLVVVAGQS